MVIQWLHQQAFTTLLCWILVGVSLLLSKQLKLFGQMFSRWAHCHLAKMDEKVQVMSFDSHRSLVGHMQRAL